MNCWNKMYGWLNSFELFKPAIFYMKDLYSIRNKKKKLNFYSNFLRKGDLCFDIGANIGGITKIFLELGCGVVAVEPQKECFNYMKKKFGSNEYLILINKAVDKEKNQKEIFICNADAISSMSEKWISNVKKSERYSSFKWDKIRKTETIKLDELIKKYGKPRFCKIDVEGYELNVLKGLSQTIPYISLEFNVEDIESTKRCITYLEKIGNVLFNFSVREYVNLELKKWVEAKEMINILDSFRNKVDWGDIYAKLI